MSTRDDVAAVREALERSTSQINIWIHTHGDPYGELTKTVSANLNALAALTRLEAPGGEDVPGAELRAFIDAAQAVCAELPDHVSVERLRNAGLTFSNAWDGIAPASVHPAAEGEWRWVPVEPTKAMFAAAFEEANRWLTENHPNDHCETDEERSAHSGRPLYQAMLAASPSSPLQDEALVERVEQAILDWSAFIVGSTDAADLAREIIALIAPSRVGGEAAGLEKAELIALRARDKALAEADQRQGEEKTGFEWCAQEADEIAAAIRALLAAKKEG